MFFFFVFFPITLLITQIKVFIDAELNSRRCQMVRGSSTVTSQKTFTSEFCVWWAANETLHLLSITLPLSLHFSLQPTAWHLPLCATVLTLQSLFADWPAPLSVPLSASINILLSITKWGKHAPVGTYSEMDACGCRYIRFQHFFFFQALKEFNVSLPQQHIFFFFFCSVNIVKVWKDWKTTDLSNQDMFHLHSIHQDALKLFSSHLEFIFGPQSSPQMVSVCSETNCSSSSFCQTITLRQSLRICTSFHPSPRQPLGPSVSLSPSSRNKVPKHQQRMSVSCTHHQSKE